MGNATSTLSDDGVVHVVLDDGERRNPIGHEEVDLLEDALLYSDAGAVVLSAAEGPVFSAGGDLRLAPERLQRLSARIMDLCRFSVASATAFVVAADGLAVGSGAQLLLAADLRVLGREARLRTADVSRGLVAGAWSLPAHVGRGRALELLLTGRDLDADELVACGLAAAIEPDPVAAALALAGRLAALDPGYRERVKAAVAAAAVSLPALELERRGFVPPLRPKGASRGGR